MNQIVEYIASVPNIENVVLVGGKECSRYIVSELSMETSVKNVAIFVSNTKAREDIEEIIENLAENTQDPLPKIVVNELEKVYDLPELGENTALMIDVVDDIKTIFRLEALKPKYLCGNVKFESITTFEIWEAFRSCAIEMNLLTFGEGRRTEVLNWKKNPNSDVELSVIFPMYNIAQYLPKCIETVTAWKANYIEFLFVDDGSPDNCAEIVEKAAQADSRIKLLRKPNGGCASARQYGLDLAKGRYIGFIDPDDYIDESMYRKLLRRAFMGNYEISYSGYRELYEATGETEDIEDVIGDPYAMGTTDRNMIFQLIAYRRIAIWRGIYRKDMIDRNHIHFYTDLRRFDDLPFKVETLAVAKSVVSVPEYLYYYRMERPGQDVAANDERLYVHFSIFEHLDEFVRRTGAKELVEALQIIKLQTHIYAIQKLVPEYMKEYVKKAKKDLLNNIGFCNSAAIFKSAVGKADKAYFYAIMSGSGMLVKQLRSRLNGKARKREKERMHQLECIEKLRNI